MTQRHTASGWQRRDLSSGIGYYANWEPVVPAMALFYVYLFGAYSVSRGFPPLHDLFHLHSKLPGSPNHRPHLSQRRKLSGQQLFIQGHHLWTKLETHIGPASVGPLPPRPAAAAGEDSHFPVLVFPEFNRWDAVRYAGWNVPNQECLTPRMMELWSMKIYSSSKSQVKLSKPNYAS